MHVIHLVEQQRLLLVLGTFSQICRKRTPSTTIYDAVLFVHHTYDFQRIGWGDGSDADIPNCSEFSAVIQVLVFQSKEIPNKSPAMRSILITKSFLEFPENNFFNISSKFFQYFDFL